MADDKTTKMPEQPVTDTGPSKEPPPKPEKTPTPLESPKNRNSRQRARKCPSMTSLKL